MHAKKKNKNKNKKERKNVPTSETLLDCLKTQNINDILEIAKTQIAQCIEVLVKKGVTLNNVAIAFDWHGVRFYGKHDKEGVLGTKPACMPSTGKVKVCYVKIDNCPIRRC